MNLNIKSLANKDIGFIDISHDIFNVDYNEPLIHQVLISYIYSSHQKTKAQKSKSEVSGSGLKPWKQKGTGRARAGSIRSPIFRKGGVTFANKFKIIKQKVNKKMYIGAMRSILSELLRLNRIIVIDKLKLDSCKTKNFKLIIHKLEVKNVLYIVSINEFDKNLFLSSRNIRGLKVLNSSNINPFYLIYFKNIIFTKNAIKEIEEQLL